MSKRNNPLFSNILLSELNHEDDDEFIEIIAEEDSEMDEQEVPEELTILPLKNTVLFPGVVIPITVGRTKSIRLVKKAYKGNRVIGVIAQMNSEDEDPFSEELFEYGTVAKIVKMIVLPAGPPPILIPGPRSFKVKSFIQDAPVLTA